MNPRHILPQGLSAALLVVGTLVLSPAAWAQAPALTAHDAWMREPRGGRTMTGAFVVVENAGATPRAIVSAASDAAKRWNSMR